MLGIFNPLECNADRRKCCTRSLGDAVADVGLEVFCGSFTFRDQSFQLFGGVFFDSREENINLSDILLVHMIQCRKLSGAKKHNT